MTRLYMTVEGQTEQAFATQILTPHLAAHDVFLTKPRLTGPISRRKGRIPGGGLARFEVALGDMKRWLKEDQSPDARFTMMIDLYRLPNDFPKYGEAGRLDDPCGRVQFLEDTLSETIGDDRFIPYLQLFEFEAIVLSKPEAFAGQFEDCRPQTAKLKKLCREFASPEQINDGPTTHPAARILALFPNYQKNLDGPQLAQDIGLPAIREECPHFHQWLAKLERLGGAQLES